MSKKIISGIIPARWKSSRFPGKPLALIQNKPMIQWVYERSLKSRELDNLIVATDDQRILEAVQKFGGKAVMTSPNAKTGSDRILEAAKHPDLLDSSFIINIQGDEPLIESALIDQMALFLQNNSEIPVVTAATNLEQQNINDPNIVKVVAGRIKKEQGTTNLALYFSRSPIPYLRNIPKKHNPFLRHIGIYGYQRKSLEEFCNLPFSSLEEIEALEQLRMLENGWRIGLIFTDYEAIGVDTPGDIHLVEKKLGS